MNKKLKEWEIEKGIEIKTKNKDMLISDRMFNKLLRTKNIKIKTQKGIEYYERIRGRR